MRYENWDVILFPRDSHIPIQEFNTACYSTSDRNGQQSPTLACYIASLPPATSFRISIHSWATPAKPSALIESRQRANQDIMYKLQVIVDGTRVFHGLFGVTSKWPQEIAHEARGIVTAEHPTSHRKSSLLFPSFNPETLLRTEWDCRDTGGRINVMLSEQVVAKTSSPTEADFGPFHEIVCFSFQHAPKGKVSDTLERVGISWPIRNPLFMPNPSQGPRMTPGVSDASSEAMRAHPRAHEYEMEFSSRSAAPRPRITEPLQRPNSHPSLARISHPTMQTRAGARSSVWDNDPGLLGNFRHEATSLNPWSLHQDMSPSRENMIMTTRIDPFSLSTRIQPIWKASNQEQHPSADLEWRNVVANVDKDKSISVAHQKERLGQTLEANSPPMMQRNSHHSSERHLKTLSGRTWNGRNYTAPPVGSTLLADRNPIRNLTQMPPGVSTSGSLGPVALKAHSGHLQAVGPYSSTSPSSFQSSIASNKENYLPSQIQVSSLYPVSIYSAVTDRPVTKGRHWNSDLSARDGSSVFSSLSRHNPDTSTHFGTRGRHSVDELLTNGSVKSGKEGIAQHTSDVSEHDNRHVQAVFLPTGSSKHSNTQKMNVSGHAREIAAGMVAKTTDVEIIDVDAIERPPDPKPSSDTSKASPAKSFHKAGVSSMDSTGRLERKLYSALGEELASFDSHDHTDMSQELAGALRLDASQISGHAASVLLTQDHEQVGKRKRCTPLDGDRERQSPMSKREKGAQADLDE
ncbi:hypothetical protein FB567DRAFT_497466 [Paraphoma chrysanthemicola]|uniref:Uncharacterized protein n=1 Tax=Paraphoma chrysanthemicola TaxID=798071 RepID=A0A8K0VX78_9PLEO|nr:hypothetical protein FB567DRAFT_497466 [Paraphoma chrysanthemicola]